MMSNASARFVHSCICATAFIGWYCCFYLAWWLPGFAGLYRSGLATPFLHLVFLFPYAVAGWKWYSRRYPFLPVGRFSLRGLLLPTLALIVLTFIHGHYAHPEGWMRDFSQETTGVKALTLLTLCLLAPIGEEIIFRGFVLNSSIGWGQSAKTVGIVFTSLLFAGIHTQYQSATTLVYLFIFSAILCVVRINTRGLVIPIALHMLNNCWAMVVLLSL